MNCAGWVSVLLFLSAIGFWTPTPVAAQPSKLTFVGSGDAFFLILPYVAADKEFLKDEGIEFDHVTVQSGTREVAALMGNQADLAICGLQNVINLASRGGNVVAISRAFDVVPNALVLTNALDKAGIKLDMPVAVCSLRAALVPTRRSTLPNPLVLSRWQRLASVLDPLVATQG